MNKKITIREFLKRFDNHHALLLLVILLCTDLVFIVLSSIGILTPYFDSYLFSILIDGSYPEIFQYIKWFWILVLLILMAKERKSVGYLAIGAVYLYILMDDALCIHEKIGSLFNKNFQFNAPFCLEPQDCGEFLASAVSGLFLGPLVLIAYLKGGQYFRRVTQDMLLLYLVLIFFSCFLDLGKHLFNLDSELNILLSFIEDSGEMVAGSIILWYVFLTSGQKTDNPSFLCDYFRIRYNKQL